MKLKKKKNFKDYIKFIIFGFFIIMTITYINEIKPLESESEIDY